MDFTFEIVPTNWGKFMLLIHYGKETIELNEVFNTLESAEERVKYCQLAGVEGEIICQKD